MNIVERYDHLLARGDAEAVKRQIEEGARASNVTYGDRVVCNVLRPHFVAREAYEAILERARLVLDALHMAAAEVVSSPSWIDRLGFDARERRLIELHEKGVRDDLVGRLDSFLDQNGTPVFLEYNGESPGGIAYGDCLGEVFEQLPIMRQLASEFELSRRPVIPEVLTAFREEYVAWAARHERVAVDTPRVAIVDFEDIPTIGEFRIFRDVFERAGMPCDIVDPKHLVLDDDGLHAHGKRIDVVYRRLITPDLLDVFGGEHVLVDAMARQACFVANGFGGYTISHKGLFALLSDPALQPQGLGDAHLEAVAESIPWTRIAATGVTTGPDGVERELGEIVRDMRRRLVIKPAASYGGKDITLGWIATDEEWDRAWHEGLERPTVVQARVAIPEIDCPVTGASPEGRMRFQFDIDPYVFAGRRTHGLGIRYSGGDLLNVAAGAGSAVPAFVVG